MKVFVTGVNGQLGHYVVNELNARGHTAIGSDLKPVYSGIADGTFVTRAPYISLDITREDAVFKAIDQVKPDALVHCAAWTAVDAAEEPDNRKTVFAVNEEGTRHIARASRAVHAKMVYISTDYVFDGTGTEPWQADCTEVAPQNVYGESKLAGEKAVRETLESYFIVRTAWVFGLNGKNFVRTMVTLGKTHRQLRVVSDQIGTPTYTPDLARLLVDMVQTERFGTYHATNEGGFISWADFATEIFRQTGQDVEVFPVTTAEYGLSKAKRPFNSRLSKEKLAQAGFERLPTWQDALTRYLKEATL
ncbi:MAG: dTDP-4-dehydrorhamnose reductase [Sutterella sp.]|nr:dTDP-4-dehydrorhamnose reductase [Sutterella sp.]